MKFKFLSFLKRTLNFIMFSNLFVAISVTALGIETMIMFNIFDFKYPIFLFSLTLFIYCFHRIYRLNHRSQKEQLEGRHVWVKENKKLFLGILFLSTLGILYSIIFWVSLSTFLFLIPVGVISLAYSIPCIKTSEKLLRLRDIRGIKIFVIAIVLGLTTVILPLVFYNKIGTVASQELLFVLMRRILFVFAITIPFDIRDIEYDTENNVKTIPILFGIKKSKQLAILALILFIFLALLQSYTFSNLHSSYIISIVLSALIALIMIIKTNHQREELFYPSFIEGTMLLQFVLVVLFKY